MTPESKELATNLITKYFHLNKAWQYEPNRKTAILLAKEIGLTDLAEELELFEN